MALVHIIGTKYTDYFTDGTNITAFPGDPQIDAHLSERDAPIPTHQGLTWDHTTGGYLYDTASGDLEIGDYAVQPNGSYIQNAPPFVSSTSTSAVFGETNASLADNPSTSTEATNSPASSLEASEQVATSSNP